MKTRILAAMMVLALPGLGIAQTAVPDGCVNSSGQSQACGGITDPSIGALPDNSLDGGTTSAVPNNPTDGLIPSNPGASDLPSLNVPTVAPNGDLRSPGSSGSSSRGSFSNPGISSPKIN